MSIWGWLGGLVAAPAARLRLPTDPPAPKARPLVAPDVDLGLAKRAGGPKRRAPSAEPGFAVIKELAQPTSLSPTRAFYRLGGPRGLMLRPGEEIRLAIPPELHGRPVYQVILEHRQEQAHKTSVPTGTFKKWDQTPGITALHFHPSGGGEWRYWNAPWGSSGADGGKYAEIRDDWESESHFDFHKHGTSAVGSKDRAHALLTIDALRLRGIGDDPTFVRGVAVTFAPPPATVVRETIFTPGTAFGDLLTAAGQTFGKDKKAGTYPGALTLLDGAGGGPGLAKLGEGQHFVDGHLELDLVPGLELLGVEVAVGDTKPDGQRNTDGDIGTQGHSRLSLGLRRAGAERVQWFVDDHGVPPQGVIFGGPDRRHVTQPGDRLVVAAREDPTYLMGIRVGYRPP